MQHPNPTVGNNPFLANNTGFGNKKAPSWLEKGAKNDPPYMRMKVELVGFEPTSKHIRRMLSTCLFWN